MRKALFLDRDGTINEYGEYLHKIEDMKFIDGVINLIKRFNEEGWLVIVITNQAGVARGYYKEEDVKTLHKWFDEELSKYGAGVDDWYYCPHHPTAGIGKYKLNCDCRKPNTKMLKDAAKKWNIDLKNSFLIGDNITDIQCAQKLNMNYLQVTFNKYDVDAIYKLATKGDNYE